MKINLYERIAKNIFEKIDYPYTDEEFRRMCNIISEGLDYIVEEQDELIQELFIFGCLTLFFDFNLKENNENEALACGTKMNQIIVDDCGEIEKAK